MTSCNHEKNIGACPDRLRETALRLAYDLAFHVKHFALGAAYEVGAADLHKDLDQVFRVAEQNEAWLKRATLTEEEV